MTHSKHPFHCAWIPAIALLPGGGLWHGLAAQAQVVPDATLPMPSVVSPGAAPNLELVTGGTRQGNHLFHSFEQFSIAPGATVEFSHGLDLAIIFTRVTGGDRSILEGTLATQGSADFFLINPNGFLFGPEAQLNIGGSFVASSASQVEFSDGTTFSAVAPQPTDLLSINVPVGLQYGAAPGVIEVLGKGHGLEIDPATLAIVPVTPPAARLAVNPGQTLALLGGPVLLEGGNVAAPAGRIALGGVGDGGRVGLLRDDLGWRLDYQSVPQFEDVVLDFAASATSSGPGGGEIELVGQFVDLFEGSTLLANTAGNQAGRGIQLTATEGSLIQGAAFDPSGEIAVFPTSLFSEVALDAEGAGGDIAIATPVLEVSDGAQVSTSTFGFGNGGDLTIRADEVVLSGGTVDLGPSGFYLDVADFFAEGNGGNLDLLAGQLTITNGANIAANTFGLGNGGRLQLRADQIDLLGGAAGLGSSRIVAQVEGGLGKGAQLELVADQLNILDGAQISSSLFFAEGNGGPVNVQATDLTLAGTSPSGIPSGIISQVDADSLGRGSDITIQAERLAIAQGAQLISLTRAEGDAGTIAIAATEMDLAGSDSNPTGIFSTVEAGAVGNGGNIEIDGQSLRVVDGAQVAVGTKGPGNAGTLDVDVSQAVLLQGGNENGRSGLFANALVDTGAGGDIVLQSDRLVLQDGATLNVSNFASNDATEGSLPQGQGAAGSIVVEARQIELLNGSTITASTSVGDRGNIMLTGDQLLMRQGSRIATDAQGAATGGNITLNGQFIIIPANENSDITANAIQGQGGNVTVTATSLLGTQFRPRLTPQSDITASSEFGLNGTVVIDQLKGDPSSGSTELPETVAERGNRLVASCPSEANAEFVVSGRGGIPNDPGLGLEEQVLINPPIPIQTDSVAQQSLSQQVVKQLSSPTYQPDRAQPEWSGGTSTALSPVAEAQGWQKSADGSIRLLANSHAFIATASKLTCRQLKAKVPS